MTNHINENQLAVRFACLAISLLSNLFLLFFIIYKVFIKREKQINVIFQFLVIYISGTIFTMLYNIVYRFVVDGSVEDCQISDTIEEILVAIMRSILLLYYVLMVYKFFPGFKKVVYAVSTCIVIFHLLILPAIYISYMKSNAIASDDYGVYCKQDWDSPPAYISAILYQVIDCLFTVLVLVVVVLKMHSLYVILDHDSIFLIAIVKKALVLCSISIVSSWLLMFVGRLSVNSPLRWFYPLDYAINSWCLFLWFDWKEFEFCNFKTKQYQKTVQDISSVGSIVDGTVTMEEVYENTGDL